MSNEKYEARVKSLAEEMAREWESKYIEHTDDEYFQATIEEYIPTAKIALKYMAEMYVQGWKDSREGSFLVDPISLHLQEYGLIPEPESKEDNTNNTCNHPDIGTDGGGDYCKHCGKRWYF